MRAFLNEVSGRCDTYSELSWLGVGFVRSALVLLQERSELATNISLTLDELVADRVYLELITNHMHAAECPTSVVEVVTQRVDWYAMRGLFYLVWAIVAAGLAFGCAKNRLRRPSDDAKRVGAVPSSSTAEEGEGAALLTILEKLSRLEDKAAEAAATQPSELRSTDDGNGFQQERPGAHPKQCVPVEVRATLCPPLKHPFQATVITLDSHV